LEGIGVSKSLRWERGGVGCDHPLDNLAVMPAEFVFDAVEAELERHGIDP
jgi:hypothetical protein